MCKKCGSCDIGHWYSEEHNYTNAVQDDGEHTIKQPCESHTHYCYQFNDGQRKIADDVHFKPDSAPDWCPLMEPNLIQKNGCESEMSDMSIQESTETTKNTVLQSTANGTEENTMSEEMEKASPTEVSSRRQYAEKLHNEIIYNAEMVCNYLVELCKNLKRMRDENYYTELGYDTFDDYIEKDVGIKKRQAYTYISTYERLGDTFLQSNAKIGITKLAMLTEVPAVDRPDFAENNDLAEMSTREIKELVEKSKQQGEQLSLLTGERDKAKEDADDSLKEADKAWKAQEAADSARLEATQKLKEAQNRAAVLEQENEKLKKAEPDTAAIEQIRKDAEKKARKDMADKLKAEKEKAKAAALVEAEEKIKAAREEGEKAGAERVKNSLEAVEQEKAAALEKAVELEKKLKVASNQDTALFNFLFDSWQEDFNKMCGLIKKVNESDSDFAGKMSGAVKAVMEQQKKQLM